MRGIFFLVLLASNVAVGQIVKKAPSPDSLAGKFVSPHIGPGFQMKNARLQDIWSQNATNQAIYTLTQDHMVVVGVEPCLRSY